MIFKSEPSQSRAFRKISKAYRNVFEIRCGINWGIMCNIILTEVITMNLHNKCIRHLILNFEIRNIKDSFKVK